MTTTTNATEGNTQGAGAFPPPVAPPVAADEIRRRMDELLAAVTPRAEKFEPRMRPCHWFNHDPSCENFCPPCARKRLRKLRAEKPGWFVDDSIDGGWDTDHDSQPHCDTCGRMLRGTLTDYGMEQELDHFRREGVSAKNADDCYSLYAVLVEIDRGDDIYADLRAMVPGIRIGEPKRRFAEPKRHPAKRRRRARDRTTSEAKS